MCREHHLIAGTRETVEQPVEVALCLGPQVELGLFDQQDEPSKIGFATGLDPFRSASAEAASA